MKHHKSIRKLGRKRNQRKALMKSLVRALIIHEKIQTTEAKAKEMRPFIEKLITKSKNTSLATRRLIISRVGEKELAKKLVEELAPRYKDRNGGYTRITKITPRREDSARRAIIEFV